MKIFLQLFVFYLFFPFSLLAQKIITDSIPSDLAEEKVIFLKFDKVNLSEIDSTDKGNPYVLERQQRHNNIIEGVNADFEIQAKEYINPYKFSTLKKYKQAEFADCKYVLISRAYDNKHLVDHPEEDILIVFEYFLLDKQNMIAYKMFELDEMKVYDNKLIIKKFNKRISKFNN